MFIVTRQTRQTFCWTFLLMAVLSFVAADIAMAQRPGGRRRGAQPSGGQKDAPRPRNPQESERPPAPGTQVGYILKYKESDAEDRKEDEDLIGILKIKPYGKKTTVLTIQVRRTEDLKIKLDEHVFENDALNEVLKSRLDVSVDWDFLDPDSKRDDKYKKKVLRSLTFKTTIVEGEVEEILDGGRVIVSGIPSNSMQWPDYVPPENGQSKSVDAKPRKKKLKLRVLDDVSKFFTKDAEESGLSDFNQGDKVLVTVVYAGSKPGFVIKMQPPGMKDPTPAGDDAKGDEPRTPEEPPRPRGGGRRGQATGG